MSEQSNRVYGAPEKYVSLESKPELSEEEKRKAEARMRVAMRQHKLEQKTDEYIDLINQNHGIRGKHVGAPKSIEIDQTKEEEYGYDTRYIARKRLEQRIKANEKIKKQARNLKIKKIATAIVLCGTLAGGVIAIINSANTLETEPVIEQTEEEYEAGLTEEQLQAKQALDEAENAKLQALIDQSNELTQEHNQQVEDAINASYGRSR